MKTVCEPARFGFPLSRTISIVRLILLVRFTSVSENSETRGYLITVTDRTNDLRESTRARLFSTPFSRQEEHAGGAKPALELTIHSPSPSPVKVDWSIQMCQWDVSARVEFPETRDQFQHIEIDSQSPWSLLLPHSSSNLHAQQRYHLVTRPAPHKSLGPHCQKLSRMYGRIPRDSL